MTGFEILLWVGLPYAAAALFVGGHVLRYRYDRFGWTSRSSEVYEKRILAWGSPLFHYGILAVFAGHVIGLLVPKEWVDATGIPEHWYHLLATWGGTAAAVVTIVGLVILLSRRGAIRRMFRVTTVMDVVMYTLLAATIAFGTIATINLQVVGPGYEYRHTVSVWVRSVILFQPDVAAMTAAPLWLQLHALVATALFAVWPFTRLVHVLSVPVWYLFRPYIVYRARDPQYGVRKAHPGWRRSVRPYPRSDRTAPGR